MYIYIYIYIYMYIYIYIYIWRECLEISGIPGSGSIYDNALEEHSGFILIS